MINNNSFSEFNEKATPYCLLNKESKKIYNKLKKQFREEQNKLNRIKFKLM